MLLKDLLRYLCQWNTFACCLPIEPCAPILLHVFPLIAIFKVILWQDATLKGLQSLIVCIDTLWHDMSERMYA